MPCDKASHSNSIIVFYLETLLVSSPRQIPSKDRNWLPGVKTTQAMEASLQVCRLALSVNPK
jgi:hypothetical protein